MNPHGRTLRGQPDRHGFIYLRQRMLSPATELFMQLVREIEKEQAQRNRELMRQLQQRGSLPPGS